MLWFYLPEVNRPRSRVSDLHTPYKCVQIAIIWPTNTEIQLHKPNLIAPKLCNTVQTALTSSNIHDHTKTIYATNYREEIKNAVQKDRKGEKKGVNTFL